MTTFEFGLLVLLAIVSVAALNATGKGTYWRPALWLAVVALVAYLVWASRQALFPFAVGAIFAYALTPLVDRVASIFPAHSARANVYRRGIAVLLVYLAMGAFWVGIGILVVPVAAEQITQFIDELPQLVKDAQAETNEWLDAYRDRVPEDAQERIDQYADDAADVLQDQLAATSDEIVAIVTGTITILFGFVVVPFWMFYALRDRHQAADNFWNAIPLTARSDVQNTLAIADRLLGRYLRGQLILGVVVGLAVGIGLTLMDVELSLALGVVAGITELIPIIGPWIGALPALVIVAATDPDKLIWVALLYVAVQQVENNLLVPRIQGQAVDLHPAMIILLLVAGGAVFGLLGLIVIVPVTAMLREIFWYADHRLSGMPPDDAMMQTKTGRQVQEHRGRAAPTLVSAAETADLDIDAATVEPDSEVVPLAGAPDEPPASEPIPPSG